MRFRFAVLAAVFLSIPFLVIQGQKPQEPVLTISSPAEPNSLPEELNDPVVEELSQLRLAFGESNQKTSREFQEKLSELFRENPVHVLNTDDDAPGSLVGTDMLTDAELAKNLRETCRLLTTKADQLELEKNYSTGDSMRKMAKRLRKLARNLDQ